MTAPVAARVASPIGTIGGGFMMSRQAKAAGADLGLTNPWSAYFAGRCGVLGEVDAQAVVDATVFYNPDTVTACWQERRQSGVAPDVAAERYRQACLEWGRMRLAGTEGVGRAADLLQQAADSVPEGSGLRAPLFFGWRALPRPAVGDDCARVTLAAQVLREHRMAVHAAAVRAAGLTPLEAILSGAGGEGNAAFFGWPPPYPDISRLLATRRAVEQRTDELAQAPFDGLSDAEASELVALLEPIAAAGLRRPA